MLGNLIEDYTDTKLISIYYALLFAVERCNNGWCHWMLELWTANLELVEQEVNLRGIKLIK